MEASTVFWMGMFLVMVSGKLSIGGVIGALGVSFVSPVDSSIMIWSMIKGSECRIGLWTRGLWTKGL